MLSIKPNTRKKQSNTLPINSFNPIPAPMVRVHDDEVRPMPVIQVPVPAPQIPAPVINPSINPMAQDEIAKRYPAPQVPLDNPPPQLTKPLPPAPIIPLTNEPLQTGANMNFPQSESLPPAPIIPLTPDTTTPADVPFNQRTGEMLPPAPVVADTSIRPRIAQNDASNVLPAPVAPVSRSQELFGEINQIDKKDYSKARYDEQGNLVKTAGNDRDKKWSLGDKFISGLIGALGGFATGGLGGAVVGGIRAGTNRNFMEQRSDAQNRAQLSGQYGQAIEAENNQISQDYKRATTENIYDDNRFNREKAAQTNEFNRLKLERTLEDKTLDRQEKAKQATIKRIFANKRFDPATASEFDKQELRNAGIEPDSLGRFDFTNPTFKQIGGTTYKYNNSTGAFEETNLPKDGSKEVIDFEVKMPGEDKPRTFKVTQEKAASFTTQMRAAGIQADLAERRFAYQKEYNAETLNLRREQIDTAKKSLSEMVNYRNQLISLRERALNSTDEASRLKAEQDIKRLDAQMDNFKTLWKVRVKDGALTEDEYDELTADMP